MKYDLFTHRKKLAEAIQEQIDRAYMVDTTERPDIFQFFDITSRQMLKVKEILDNYNGSIEIKDSKTGELVWPSESGCKLDQVLDLPY